MSCSFGEWNAQIIRFSDGKDRGVFNYLVDYSMLFEVFQKLLVHGLKITA